MIEKTKNSHLYLILLILCTFLTYASSLGNAFIWDDLLVVVYNDFIKSWRNFPLIFTDQYLTSPQALGDLSQGGYGSGEISYRPVVTTTYFLDYAIWKLNPFGYHLTNLILHILNVLLCYQFVHLILRDEKRSWVAAMIFALHPVHSETVNNISFREDLLAFMFYILAFIFFIKCQSQRGIRKTKNYVLSNMFFLVAVFSKEMAVTFPLMIMIYDLYFPSEKNQTRFWQRLTSHYAGYILIGLFYLWVWTFVFPSKSEPFIFEGQNAYTNFLTMTKVFGIYLGWLVYPVYIHPIVSDWSMGEFSLFSTKVIPSLMAILVCFILAFLGRRSFKVVSFAVIWFFISLFPVSNILPIQNIMASRYLYVPIAGFALGVVGLLSKSENVQNRFVTRNFISKTLPLGLAGLLVVYAVSTFTKSFVWKNGETFFIELSRHYPQKDWIFRGLADSWATQGLINQAYLGYSMAKELNPSDVRNYLALGKIYLQKGMLDQAIKEFSFVVEQNPQNSEAYSNLCSALGDKGQSGESIACFKKLLLIHPQHAGAYYNLGVIYRRTNNLRGAKELFEKALAINPHFKIAEQALEDLRTP